LSAIARAALTAQNVEIEDDALALLVSELPGHRGMANQEIEKLALYGHNLGRAISSQDIRTLSTVDTDHALYELVGAVLGGNIAAAETGLDRLKISGTSPISILRGLQREVGRLMQAHALSGSGGEVGMKLRPPVFKSDWPVFRSKMTLWTPKRLARIIERIYDAEATIKSSGPMGDAIIRKLISELSNVAASAR